MFGLIPIRTNNATDKGGALSDFFNDFFNDDFLSPMGIGIDMSKFNADVRETENEFQVII